MSRHEISSVSTCVKLEVAGKPGSAHLTRIDEDNANPLRLWQEMGKPEYLSVCEVEALQVASALDPQAHPLGSWKIR